MLLSDKYRAILTAKHDEGMAAVREMISRNGEDDMAEYMMLLIEETQSEDDAVMLKAHLALLGLMHAWLNLIEQEEND